MKRFLLIILTGAALITAAGCRPIERDYVALLAEIFPGSTITKIEGESGIFFVKYEGVWRRVTMNTTINLEAPRKENNVAKEIFPIRKCEQATFFDETVNLPLIERSLSCGQ